MSLQQFSNTIQSKIYKDWFAKLDKNIVNTSAEQLRSREQVAAKTSFYITKDTVQDMYKTITGNKMDYHDLQLFMQELAVPFSEKKSGTLTGKKIQVNGKDAVYFESIGFDTISTKLNALLNSYPEVEQAYYDAETNYLDNELSALRNSAKYKSMKLPEKQKAEADIAKKAKERATLGYYFNKGHVISIATNLTKQFKEEIQKADVLAAEQRKALIDVLDKYIDKLQKDDLATANLPSAVDQELYAGYTKSSGKYLVEIQHRVGNIEAGAASIPIVKELRELFNVSSKDILEVLKNSPALGQALVETEGSPSFKQLIINDIVNTIAGKPLNKKVYVQKPTLVSKKTNKISKPASNKAKIAEAKALKEKLKRVKSDPKKIVEQIIDPQLDLLSLTSFINTHLQDVISANMGDGTQRDVLNYRTGRLATSAKIERLSQSREGMVTAFYTYMKNPYATFSEGGKQEYPKSRDPKLLISKSIREIAAEKVATRLRAVVV